MSTTNGGLTDTPALSLRQQRFVDEYVADLNGTQAAIRAGYSENGAKVQGHRLLTNANVRAAIDRLVAKRREELHVTAATITADLREDRRLAHAANQAGAAVSATTALAKLHGLWVERKEVRVTDMADAQVEEELALLRAELAALEQPARH